MVGRLFCPYCLTQVRTFTDRDRANRHIAFHHPYQCHYRNCLTMMTDEESLDVHIRNHQSFAISRGWFAEDCAWPGCWMPKSTREDALRCMFRHNDDEARRALGLMNTDHPPWPYLSWSDAI